MGLTGYISQKRNNDLQAVFVKVFNCYLDVKDWVRYLAFYLVCSETLGVSDQVPLLHIVERFSIFHRPVYLEYIYKKTGRITCGVKFSPIFRCIWESDRPLSPTEVILMTFGEGFLWIIDL